MKAAPKSPSLFQKMTFLSAYVIIGLQLFTIVRHDLHNHQYLLADAAPASHHISWDDLPGTEKLNPKPNFNMYSGYIEIDRLTGKNIMYWFFESDFDVRNNPKDDPIVLWTNGGPGCSGFLGLLTEHGPLLARKAATTTTATGKGMKSGGKGGGVSAGSAGTTMIELTTNEFSWNKLANMLYIETPAGVGFSYSDTLADYKTGDTKTANDNLKFILNWLKLFPEYAANDFYIASESYGGHYMPTLADTILTHNAGLLSVTDDVDDMEKEKGKPKPKATTINFKGMAVGNPYVEWASNTIATYDSFWGKQLVPLTVYKAWRTRCVDGGYKGHLPECAKVERQMDEFIGNLNPYALDYDVCLNQEDQDISPLLQSQRLQLRKHTALARHNAFFSTHAISEEVARSLRLGGGGEGEGSGASLIGQMLGQPGHGGRSGGGEAYEPCAEAYAATYLNQLDVKKALHVRHGIEWAACSDRIVYSDKDVLNSMVPLYDKLVGIAKDNAAAGGKFDILVFSGDDDSVCATHGTQWWIYDLGYDVIDLWKPWLVDGQVAGYVTKFDGFTFVTVHGAGHEVPAYEPARAFALFKNFLAGGTW